MSNGNGNGSKFKTSDLYLAAALKIHGFKLLDIEFTGHKGIFIFADSANRPKIVRDYFSGELTGSLKSFSNAWSDLKSCVIETEIRDGVPYHR